MNLTLVDGLPFCVAKITYQDRQIEIPDVLVDTGSASTVFSSDWVEKIGIVPEASDILRTLRGVGGREVVFTRRVNTVNAGELSAENFEIELGGMDYGFQINGILGMDFLLQTQAMVNLAALTLDRAN